MLTATIDLTEFVVARIGDWWTNAEDFTPTMLRLSRPGDGLTLAGPLRVKISVQAQNQFQLVGSLRSALQTRDLFSYVLDIPPGQTWTYPSPRFWQIGGTSHDFLPPPPPMSGAYAVRSMSQPLMADSTLTIKTDDPSAYGDYHAAEPVPGGSGGTTTPPPPSSGGGGVGTLPPPPPGGSGIRQIPPPPGGSTPGGSRVPPPPPGGTPFPPRVEPQLPFGSNAGLAIVIRPAGHDACSDPCLSVDPDPCAPKRRKDCGCHSKPCNCHGGDDDIPCDVAVENIPNLGAFFPASCEPCSPGASIGAPVSRGPSLIVRPASGGTVRTRYYNGMFIGREDLETDQRNVRLKRALMNRAMGQGVVWGLNVGLDGDALCVMPGYGVDCCGNDLVVTTPYRVDTAALLRDPAAAPLLAKRGPQRFHLVLEYFECPEQPRPVHGDPCAPDATRCETSRVRETTRLRLAPPCEIDDSGPIKDFLAEIEKLKSDPVIGAALTPAPQTPTAVSPQVPFDVNVTLTPSGLGRTLSPRVSTDPQPNRVRADIDASNNTAAYRVTLTPRGTFQFVSGNMVRVREVVNGVPTPVNAPFVPQSQTATQIMWIDKLPDIRSVAGTEPITATTAVQLQGWRLRDANGVEIEAAATEIQFTTVRTSEWRNQTPWGQANPQALPQNSERAFHVQVPATEARIVTRPPRMPCMSEACDPNGRPRFPVQPPWLHEDPLKPGMAADPKVIILAIAYSWLAMVSARDRIGTSQAVTATRFDTANAIYQLMWRLFFTTQPDTDRVRLTDAIQRLLRAWCCALLYPGPKCLCEPHGVVIGCATASAGQIHHVDPWGGRRWVVHYPLLSYWGQQFGIMPLDALASKFFDLICCVASLPAPRTDDRIASVRLASTAAAAPTGRGAAVNVGSAMLISGDETEATTRMDAFAVKPASTTTVSPFDFVMRFVDSMRFGEQPQGERPLVHYRVLGVPDLHLVAPGDPAPPATPVRPAEPGRLRNVIRTSFARRTEKTAVPPLLADFAEDVSRDLLTRLDVQPAAEAERPVLDRLADAGVTTIGAVLGRAPTDLHEAILHRENAAELAGLIDQSEQTARAVSKAVGDAVVAAAADGRIVARTDVKKPEVVLDLTRRIEEKLKAAKVQANPETIAAALSASSGES